MLICTVDCQGATTGSPGGLQYFSASNKVGVSEFAQSSKVVRKQLVVGTGRAEI